MGRSREVQEPVPCYKRLSAAHSSFDLEGHYYYHHAVMRVAASYILVELLVAARIPLERRVAGGQFAAELAFAFARVAWRTAAGLATAEE